MTQRKPFKLLSNLYKEMSYLQYLSLTCIFTLCTLRHLKSISPLYYSLLRLIGSLPQWSWTASVWFSSPCSPSSPPWPPSPWRPTCSSGEHEQKTEEWFELIGQLSYFVKYAQNAYMNHLVLLKINISLCFVCRYSPNSQIFNWIVKILLYVQDVPFSRYLCFRPRVGPTLAKGRTNSDKGSD